MKILIAGPGAAGLFIARRLSFTNEVHLLHHSSEFADKLNDAGFTCIEDGREHHCKLPCSTEIPSHIDSILVAVKTYSLVPLITKLKTCAPQSVLTVQNGLGNCELLCSVFSIDRIYAGILTYGMARHAYNKIELRGTGNLEIGGWGLGESVNELASLYGESGLATSVCLDVRRAVWLKVGVNACINPIATILDISNGELLEKTEVSEVWQKVAHEVSIAAAVEGIDLPDREIITAATNVALLTAGNYCSMVQDRRAGRHTEIDAICGQIAKRLEDFGWQSSECARLKEQVMELSGTSK